MAAFGVSVPAFGAAVAVNHDPVGTRPVLLRLPLFRQEAQQAQEGDALGVALSAQPPRSWVMTTVAVLFVSIALAAAVLGEYTRKERVSGVLAPTRGAVRIFTPQAGTLVALSASEGSRVRRGDLLATISSERASAASPQPEAAVQRELRDRRDSLQREAERQAELRMLGEMAGRERVQGLERQLAQADDQVELQRNRVTGSQRQLEGQRTLRVADYISEQALQEKEQAFTDQRVQMASALRSAAALNAELAAARNDLVRMRLTTANVAAQLHRQISEIEQQLTEVEERRSVLLRAPIDGTVTTVQADIGQTVNPNAALLTLLPDGAALEARLVVPSRAAGFIHAGQTVALRYQAVPFERYGHALGTVVHVGQVVLSPEEAGMPGVSAASGYRVTVRLPSQGVLAYGRSMPLQAGMALDADIWIDRRRIVEWLFDPVLAIKGRL